MTIVVTHPQPTTIDSASYQALSDEFREYAYSVSHDLSAPVRAMVEFSKLLVNDQQYSLDPEGEMFLGLVIENGKKMQAMMDGLLQYSRLNTQQVAFTRLSLEHIVECALTELRDEFPHIREHVHVGELPEIDGDGRQLTLLFRSLLSNAMRYHEPQQSPRIIVEATKSINNIIVSVLDNGIGIPEALQKKTYGLFSRLHTDEEYPGVGMGLTLAQKIVQHHNGIIWCDARPDGGTAFHCSFSQGA